MKKYILPALILCTMQVSGQGLQTGQMMPDVPMSQLIHSSADCISLKDFSGKLVILDFWTHSCLSCIKSFPKLDSLQKAFNKEIQIICICAESKDSTLRFFAKKKNIKIPGVLFVTGDTLFSQLFPHKVVPHHIWIDSTGKIVFITDGYNLTVHHLETFLNNQPLSLREKKEVSHFDFSKPILTEGNGRWVNKAEFYSTLLHRLPQKMADFADPGNHILLNSKSIAALVKYAYKGTETLAPDQLVLHVTEPFKYQYPKDHDRMDQWSENYCYCYELKVPADRACDIFKIMQEDLKHYFNIDTRLDKKKIRCLVLTQTGNTKKLWSPGGKREGNWLFDDNSDSLTAINYSFLNLVEKLKSTAYLQKVSLPFVDATQLQGSINITLSKINLNNFNIPGLNKELMKYGLAIKVKKWPVDVITISEKK